MLEHNVSAVDRCLYKA